MDKAVKKNKLYEYIFDVVVIFVGISISFYVDNWKRSNFYVDNWKRSNEEDKLEIEYLNGFLQDLKLR